MSFSGTASQIVAAFAANFDPSRLGEDHVVRCGRALADTMAVAIAAQNEAQTADAFARNRCVQPLLEQFPTQINRENILGNREFLAGNREFVNS